MDLHEIVGLKKGYARMHPGRLFKEFPIVHRTLVEGTELPGYSPVVTHVYRDGNIRYLLKRNGGDYFRFLFQIETDSVWDTSCGPLLPTKEWDCFKDRHVLIREDSEQLGASVYIMDSEVLPSSESGEPIRIQVTGYPSHVKVVEAEPGSSYMLMEKTKDGDVPFWQLDDGEFWSHGVSYHLVFREDKQRQLRGTLHHRPRLMDNLLFAQITRIEDQSLPGDACIVYVNTQFGELGIIISAPDKLKDREQMIPGNYLFAELQIRGIAAIGDRSGGITMNLEDDLRVMKSVMMGHSPVNSYFILPLLADDVTYYSQYDDKTYRGIREVIAKIKYTMESLSIQNVRAELSVVLSSGPECNSPREPGTLCLAVDYHEEGTESLIFFELDNERRIREIRAVNYEGYQVRSVGFWRAWETEVDRWLHSDFRK